MSLMLVVNGQNRAFEALNVPASLGEIVAELGLKGDRVAVEHNGAIVDRGRWAQTSVAPGDRLEIVHFVGGGSWERQGSIQRPEDGPSFCNSPGPAWLTIHNIRYRT
jgi:sulfur carrier protein